ncbi:MAG TPA: DNA polymerase/3'-5' exonuclease PolX [Methanomassiliicoccales archaeon]|nr:DNA polymerase/3'-5' exonuclease PolX [Methanomassiliicoccales archaeon]
MRNAEVASIFYQIADLLDLEGVQFKPTAYRKAARSIESLSEDIADVRKRGELRKVPGVGEAIEKKIEEIVDTGHLAYLDELKEEYPAGLLQVMSVPDIGPKTAVRLYKELKVTNLADLKKAAQEHRIRELKGFGEKSEQSILHGIEILERRSGRMLLGYAYPIAESIVEYLKKKANTENVSLAGSLRRMKETIGDLDILMGTDDPRWAMDIFTSHPEVAEIVVRGDKKVTVRLQSGVQVDLRVAKEVEYGAAQQYFTGSKDHNIVLRQMAIDRGWKLNEYGLFEKDSGKVVAREKEEDIYKALGLEIMPPEIRENTGEVEASLNHRLPKLVELKEIKGDFHVHTNASDGNATMEEIAYACKRRGYEYVGITDHSEGLKVANGLSVERLKGNVDVARNLSKLLPEVKVLIGAEVEIEDDGTLGYPDSVLKDLDFVLGSVHSKFNMSEKEMTERVLTALSNDYITILGHPTGRVLEQREPYALDLDRVMRAAKDNGVCLELNAFPERLDLKDAHCRKAKEIGVKVAIGTDSHAVGHLDNMLYGVATARRGWLEKNDLLNTMSIKDLEKFLAV